VKISKPLDTASNDQFDASGDLRRRFKELTRVEPSELDSEADGFIGHIRSIVQEIGAKSVNAKTRKNCRVKFVNSVKKAAANARLLDKIAWLELARGNDHEADDLIRRFYVLQELATALSNDVDNIVLTKPDSLASDAVLIVFEIYSLRIADGANSFADQCNLEILRCAGLGETEQDRKDGVLKSSRSVLKTRSVILRKKRMAITGKK
jgi:hypothetical protein